MWPAIHLHTSSLPCCRSHVVLVGFWRAMSTNTISFEKEHFVVIQQQSQNRPSKWVRIAERRGGTYEKHSHWQVLTAVSTTFGVSYQAQKLTPEINLSRTWSLFEAVNAYLCSLSFFHWRLQEVRKNLISTICRIYLWHTWERVCQKFSLPARANSSNHRAVVFQ